VHTYGKSTVWFANDGGGTLDWFIVFLTCITTIMFPVPEVWKQVLKRKHALDHRNAIMPVHASQLKTCTSASDVGCHNM
jgi:hypothetical protein